MKITLYLPERILRRVKKVATARNVTFRALVIDALERSLEVRSGKFRLRDAFVGAKPDGLKDLSPETVNRTINAQREHSFRQ